MITLTTVTYIAWKGIEQILLKFFHPVWKSRFGKIPWDQKAAPPVEQAKTVNTETHQDAVEIRFNQMAFGGTVALVIIISLLIYLLRLQKKLALHRRHA